MSTSATSWPRSNHCEDTFLARLREPNVFGTLGLKQRGGFVPRGSGPGQGTDRRARSGRGPPDFGNVRGPDSVVPWLPLSYTQPTPPQYRESGAGPMVNAQTRCYQ